MSDDVLKNFQGKSDILKFNDDGEVTGIYKGVGEEPDPFSKTGGNRLAYQFSIDGVDKVLGSTSKRLAKAMYESSAKPGDTVNITRFGEKYETVYRVKILQSSDKPVEAVKEEIPVDEKDIPF